MTTYCAPVQDTAFVLFDVLHIDRFADLPGFAGLTRETVHDLLTQVGEFSERTLHPLNQVGDRLGCVRHPDGTVTTPPGFPEAYRRLVADGWPGAAGPTELGGGGLPHVLGFAFLEYLWAANPAFTMHASHLGHASVLMAHGDPTLRATYGPHLVAGDWSGAMALTEPQAGTDLGLIRTTAADAGDGTYRIRGDKIFISGGESDLAENIVHFVLARLPGAPSGAKGLSLFLVPKYLVGADGSLGARNGFTCTGIEEKAGIHASPTCAMRYDDATGHLVGEPHRGLAEMFVLMNHMRLMTAVQGLGISEIAYQNAAQYARERRQGRRPGGDPHTAPDPIIEQPDVRRLLWRIRSFNEAARALVLFLALQVDLAERAADPGQRRAAGQLAALLGPVVKGVTAERSYDNTVDAQRVFGGHGYVRDTGAEQFVRDVRVAAIGEGVTPVQAADLVKRKLRLDDGRTVADLFARIAADAAGARTDVADLRTGAADARTDVADLRTDVADPRTDAAAGRQLEQALRELTDATDWISRAVAEEPARADSAAVDYLHLFGAVVLGWMALRITRAVGEAAASAPGRETGTRPSTRLALARHCLDRLPGEASFLAGRMREDPATYLSIGPADF
ncbi:acyl-CoA dehydrogenase [Streptomyces sp. NPDC056161]|uniref:acyl-CoA dehydrogenase n=1 Tax=Streptomyces sp. NPDC056161 TaxID=3345732 RepID=UPI0035D5DB69